MTGTFKYCEVAKIMLSGNLIRTDRLILITSSLILSIDIDKNTLIQKSVNFIPVLDRDIFITE